MSARMGERIAALATGFVAGLIMYALVGLFLQVVEFVRNSGDISTWTLFSVSSGIGVWIVRDLARAKRPKYQSAWVLEADLLFYGGGAVGASVGTLIFSSDNF